MVRILLALDDEIGQARAQTDAIADIVTSTTDATVYALHVFSDNPEGASVNQIEGVREATDRLADLGVTVELLESSGDPAEETLKHAEQYDVDHTIDQLTSLYENAETAVSDPSTDEEDAGVAAQSQAPTK